MRPPAHGLGRRAELGGPDRAWEGRAPMGVPTVEDLAPKVRSWSGRAVSWDRLAGGLSHHIFRVDVDGVPYVLRVLDPEVSKAGLGIAPEQEVDNTVRAAESG